VAAPDPAIAALTAQVDVQRLRRWVRALSGFSTRHTRSRYNPVAAKWLQWEFEQLGYTGVELQQFPVGRLRRFNVTCSRPGTETPDVVVLLGAHYDSRASNLRNVTVRAPGADDNASGTAALLEVARLLREFPTRCTVRFAAFTGEEQHMLGSTAYAARARAEGMRIRLMFNMDMIGSPADPMRPAVIIERVPGKGKSRGHPDSRRYAIKMTAAARRYTSLITRTGPIYDSDYIPFERLGYPVVGAFDGADKRSFYHTALDTPDKVRAPFHAEVVRMVLATVCSVANEVAR